MGLSTQIETDANGVAWIAGIRTTVKEVVLSIGQCVMDLELIATATQPEDWINRVEFLPI